MNCKLEVRLDSNWNFTNFSSISELFLGINKTSVYTQSTNTSSYLISIVFERLDLIFVQFGFLTHGLTLANPNSKYFANITLYNSSNGIVYTSRENVTLAPRTIASNNKNKSDRNL